MQSKEYDDLAEAFDVLNAKVAELGAQVTALTTLVRILAVTHPRPDEFVNVLTDKILRLDAILNASPTPDDLNSTVLSLLDEVLQLVRNRN